MIMLLFNYAGKNYNNISIVEIINLIKYLSIQNKKNLEYLLLIRIIHYNNKY